MLPRNSMNDSRYRIPSHPIFSGKRPNCFSTAVSSPNVPNIGWRKSHQMMQCSASCLTSLSNFVGNIFRLCSQSKMLWIYAPSIIAFMKQNLVHWNWSISQLPCDPMRPICLISNTKRSVAVGHKPSGPDYAFSRFLGLAPKSFHFGVLPPLTLWGK